MNFIRRWGAVALIVLLGSWLRLWRLDAYPVSLNWDEVSHGYNAYAIWQTGADEWGIRWPMIFRAFGDFKLPVYIYSTVPWVAIGGLNAWSVRLSSVLAGTASILWSYLLVREFGRVQILLKRGEQIDWSFVGLLTSLLVAVAPWTVFLSRVAVEANLGSMLAIAAAYYFHVGLSQKRGGESKAWGFVLAGLLAGLSMFTYNAFRIFVPLMFMASVLIYGPVWEWRLLDTLWGRLRLPTRFRFEARETIQCVCHLLGLGVFLLFVLGTAYQLLYTDSGQARANNISVLDQGMINTINENRGSSELPSLLPRLIHNKVTYLIGASSGNYASLMNPLFWYVSGGDHYQFSIPGHALLPSINLVMLILGIVWMWKFPRPVLWFVLSWILLAPIPASPTRDNPHTLRIITMLPMMQVIAAWGVYQSISWVQSQLRWDTKRIVSHGLYALYLVVLLVYLGNFWRAYTGVYAEEYAWAWQLGNKEMVEYVMTEYDTIDQIYITKYYGEPHAFVQFYSAWDVNDNQQNRVWEYRDAGTSQAWYWVHGLGKIRFVNDWEIDQIESAPGTLILSQPTNPYRQSYDDQIVDAYGRVVYYVHRL